MKNPTRTLLGATSAIAAALALTAAPAAAQDSSTGTLDGPIVNTPPAQPAATTSSAPADAPVVILPETTASPAPVVPQAATAPVVEPVPAQAPEAATTVQPAQPAPKAAAPAASRQAPAPKQAASQSAATAPAAPDTPTASTDSVEDAAPTAIAPLAGDSFAGATAEDSAPQAVPTPEQARDVTAILAIVLAGLIALAVAVIVALAFRRRKKTAADRRVAVARREAAERTPLATPTKAVAPAALAPAMAAAAAPALAREPRRAAAPLDDRVLDSHGASVPLPSQLPETFEERDALIKRMVDAEPDKANPFTNRRARLRRARLILQSLGRKFENAKPWIDLSQYPEIWPSQAPTAQATPAAPAAAAEHRILEPA